MLARCARCQGTFSTDHFGLQTCPHCGAELMLADPNAPAGTQPPAAPPGTQPSETRPPSPPASVGGVREGEAGGEGRGEGGTAPTGPSPAPAPPGGPVWGAPPPPPELPPPPGPPPGGYGPPAGGWGPPPPGGWGPPPPAGGGWGPPPGGGGPEEPAPFAERARLGFLASFFATWRLAALEPASFFRRVRIDQTRSAIVFAVIATTIGSWFSAIWNHLMSFGSAAQFEETLGRLPPEMAEVFEALRPFVRDPTATSLVAQLVLTPLFAFVALYLSAGILHLLLMLFRGAHRGFAATLTVVAYASAVNLLLIVPFCGSIAAIIWWIVIVIAGLEAAQRCGTGKAAAAALAPVLLFCLCCCGLGAIGFGAAFRALRGVSPPSGPIDL
jgi:hypothetical protein